MCVTQWDGRLKYQNPGERSWVLAFQNSLERDFCFSTLKSSQDSHILMYWPRFKTLHGIIVVIKWLALGQVRWDELPPQGFSQIRWRLPHCCGRKQIFFRNSFGQHTELGIRKGAPAWERQGGGDTTASAIPNSGGLPERERLRWDLRERLGSSIYFLLSMLLKRHPSEYLSNKTHF